MQLDLSIARGALALYPSEALRAAMARLLRQRPEMLTTAAPSRRRTPFCEAVALRSGMPLSPDEVLPTQGVSRR